MGFTIFVTLTIPDSDDFHKVLTFVQPEKGEESPDSDDECMQLIDFVSTLPAGERCAWMVRHCNRLEVGFDSNVEKQKLTWFGRNFQGGLTVEIAELVVEQFPDIEFRVCISYDYGLKYGISEQGKIKWLELSDDVYEMFDWGIDVNPYTGPTDENWEALRKYRRDRVQRMIDLGVNISPDTWSPTTEHFREEISLRSAMWSKDKNTSTSHLDSELPF